MHIHASDGSIEFALGRVTSATDKPSFLGSSLGRGAVVVVENGPFVTYRVVPEPGVGATLLFKGERLENVAWAFKLPDETKDDWSEESEMQRKKLHEEWLRKELGEPPHRYRWGEVASEYDAKGVSSAIMVVYDR
jgi:hypothetical protein